MADDQSTAGNSQASRWRQCVREAGRQQQRCIQASWLCTTLPGTVLTPPVSVCVCGCLALRR
jgi:hypothetical protein